MTEIKVSSRAGTKEIKVSSRVVINLQTLTLDVHLILTMVGTF